MKHQIYFPPRINEQVLWLAHFQREIVIQAAKLRLTQDELDDTLADLEWLLHALRDLRSAADHAALAITSFTKMLMKGKGAGKLKLLPLSFPPPPTTPPVRPGALTRLFMLVQRIKHMPTYDKSIGLSLGIEGNHYRADSPVPTFKLKILSGDDHQIVEGRFRRFGKPGIWVETLRGDGEWEPLGIFSRSTFRDTRPLLDPTRPEVRSYRLRFWDGVPIGEWTAVVTVTVSP